MQIGFFMAQHGQIYQKENICQNANHKLARPRSFPCFVCFNAGVSLKNRIEVAHEPLAPVGFHDLGHGHAELVFHNDDFAARDKTVVDVDIDGFTDFAVKFYHRASP